MEIENRIILDLNVKAPDISSKDIFGRQVELKNYVGKKLFIGFFRHAGCPFCNIRVHNLTKVHEELKAMNLEMIFFFESKEKVLLQSIFHKEVSPIPLIADPEKIFYNRYGIEHSPSKSAYSHLTQFIQTAISAKLKGLPMHTMADGESISTMPAEFLVDESGIIRKVHYAKTLNDRIKIDIIRDFTLSKK